MADPTGKDQFQRIREATDGETPYVLHPENNDLFVRTGKQIIASCQLTISLDLWLNELSAMMKEVHDWAGHRADRIRTCYCVPQGPSIVFFFSPQSNQFDFDLADELAAFNLHLRKFNIGMAEVRQVPWREFDRFVNPTSSRWLYGEQFRPFGAVAT